MLQAHLTQNNLELIDFRQCHVEK